MEEWKEYKISEIIEEIAMGPFGSNIKVDNFIDFGIPVLNGSNLQGFKLNEDSFNYVSEEKADSLGRANAFRDDIVITHRGTLGQIVYIPLDSKYERYIISQSQFRLRLNQNIIRPDFFVYFFHTRIGQHRILMNASQVGVPALARPTSTFKEITIPVPPMEIQNRVMAILLSLDDKIELNRRINENLEQQAQALFKSWFVDFEPFKDGKFVDSELGMIPEGWEVGTLDEVGEIVGGGTPSKSEPLFYCDNGISWITPKDLSINQSKYISKGKIDITEIGYKNSSAKKIPAGSVLFSSRAPIGYIAIARNEVTTNQGFKSVIPQKAGTCFIYLFLKYNTEYIESQATGSTFKEVSGSLMKSQKLIIPTQYILDEFEYKLRPIFSAQCNLESENQRLIQIRDTLLPKLMSGELKLGEIETKLDE